MNCDALSLHHFNLYVPPWFSFSMSGCVHCSSAQQKKILFKIAFCFQNIFKKQKHDPLLTTVPGTLLMYTK